MTTQKLVIRTLYDQAAAQKFLIPKGAVPIGVQAVPQFSTTGSRRDISINGTHSTLVSGYDSVYHSIVVLLTADKDHDGYESRTFHVVRPDHDIPDYCNLIGTIAEVNGTVRAVFLQEEFAPCMWCGMLQAESSIHDHEAECQ